MHFTYSTDADEIIIPSSNSMDESCFYVRNKNAILIIPARGYRGETFDAAAKRHDDLRNIEVITADAVRLINKNISASCGIA